MLTGMASLFVSLALFAAKQTTPPNTVCGSDNQGSTTLTTDFRLANGKLYNISVYCQGAAAYIPVNGTSSQWVVDGTNYKGSTVTSRYEFVRLHISKDVYGYPRGFSIDTDDTTFAHSTGRVTHNGDAFTQVPVGRAEQCGLRTVPKTAPAVASINLSATPFRFHPNLTAAVSGSEPFGASTFSLGRDAWQGSVSGWCGGIAWTLGGLPMFGLPVVLDLSPVADLSHSATGFPHDE
jgi:hypothetical protein